MQVYPENQVQLFYLSIDQIDSEFTITVIDKTFTGFKRAIEIEFDDSGAEFVTGETHNNVFDFSVTNPGDVATLWDLDPVKAVFDAPHIALCEALLLRWLEMCFKADAHIVVKY